MLEYTGCVLARSSNLPALIEVTEAGIADAGLGRKLAGVASCCFALFSGWDRSPAATIRVREP